MFLIDYNIKDSPYTFASDAGTFDARFELVYTQALGIPSTNFNPNSVIVYKNTDWFHVNTKGITMKEIQVYDISGRLIYKLPNINATTTVLKGLTATNEVLFLKITSEDNTTVTVKAIGYKLGWTTSLTASSNYTITNPNIVGKPTITPPTRHTNN